MKLKTITKEKNKKTIIIYYLIALVLVIIGLYGNKPRFYILAVALFLLGLFRKFWLEKKLKD